MRSLRTLAGATAAIALAAAMVAGCWSLPVGGGTLNGSWHLVTGTLRGSAVPIVAGSEPTLTVDGSEVSGIAACNHYGGTLTITGQRIGFSAMQMSEMACDPSRMASEAAYLDALGAVTTFVVGTDSLGLSGTDVDLSFVSNPPTPDAALIGTTWVLDGLVSGDAISSVLGEPATLEVDAAGALSGSTGCRSFAGGAIVGDGRLQIENLVPDDRPCSPDLGSQDGQVLDVLRSSPLVSIAGRTLTLTGAGGRGLTYRAA